MRAYLYRLPDDMEALLPLLHLLLPHQLDEEVRGDLGSRTVSQLKGQILIVHCTNHKPTWLIRAQESWGSAILNMFFSLSETISCHNYLAPRPSCVCVLRSVTVGVENQVTL